MIGWNLIASEQENYSRLDGLQTSLMIIIILLILLLCQNTSASSSIFIVVVVIKYRPNVIIAQMTTRLLRVIQSDNSELRE